MGFGSKLKHVVHAAAHVAAAPLSPAIAAYDVLPKSVRTQINRVGVGAAKYAAVPTLTVAGAVAGSVIAPGLGTVAGISLGAAVGGAIGGAAGGAAGKIVQDVGTGQTVHELPVLKTALVGGIVGSAVGAAAGKISEQGPTLDSLTSTAKAGASVAQQAAATAGGVKSTGAVAPHSGDTSGASLLDSTSSLPLVLGVVLLLLL